MRYLVQQKFTYGWDDAPWSIDDEASNSMIPANTFYSRAAAELEIRETLQFTSEEYLIKEVPNDFKSHGDWI